MVRSALFEAVATLFVAARFALRESSKAVVLNTGARRRYGVGGVGGSTEALEAFLRVNAALRLESIETPDVIQLPWKEHATQGFRGVGLSEPAPIRTPCKSTPSRRRARSYSPRTVNALRTELEQAQENAVAMNEQLEEYRNKIQEQRRSRALARAQGAETAQRIESMVQRCENILGKKTLVSSPLSTTPQSVVLSPKTPSPLSKSLSHSLEHPTTPADSSIIRPEFDAYEEIRRLRAENERLRDQLRAHESPKLSSKQGMCMSPSSLSDVTASPPSSETKPTGQFGLQYDIEEIKLQAFKEVLQARSRSRALEAELEEHRLHKAQVRDWVVQFVQKTHAEKAALTEHAHKAQSTNASLCGEVTRQRADIDALRCELVECSRARAQAEAQLGAVRAHHEALAGELSARNVELACVQQEMCEARDTYARATSIASDEMESYEAVVRSERNLVRRNLALRSEVAELTQRAESADARADALAAERDELQRSLANMANLVNTAQSKMISVEQKLCAERSRVRARHNPVEDGRPPSPPTPSSPKITTLRRQLGAVLRSPTSPKKKKHSDRETQLHDIKNKI